MINEFTQSQSQALSFVTVDEHELEVSRRIQDFYALVNHSYAHNNPAYKYFAEAADLETMTHFMRWDAVQPAYYVYLRRWVDRVPSYVKKCLVDHIHVEETEQHSKLFTDMLDHLNSLVKREVVLDHGRLRILNYTFNEECLREKNFAFFLGGFFATEVMSAKRCAQILQGLKRNCIPKEYLKFMEIHAGVDSAHGDEVAELLLKPVMMRQPELTPSIWEGIVDRLTRSGHYLQWYSRHQLKIVE